MCNCKKGKAKSGSYVVKLPGGIEVKKPTEEAAKAFAAKSPKGTTVRKVA